MTMHEISLVRHIFRTLDEQFTAGQRASITAIRLRVGLLSSVEPVLMQNAFEAVVDTEYPAYARARLHIEVLPILVQCAHCGRQSEVRQFRFRCAWCEQPVSDVVQGLELQIAGVEMDADSND